MCALKSDENSDSSNVFLFLLLSFRLTAASHCWTPEQVINTFYYFFSDDLCSAAELLFLSFRALTLHEVSLYLFTVCATDVSVFIPALLILLA